MALGAGPEEVFRFSVVRNPQSVPPDKLRDSVVKIVPDDAGREYGFFKALRRLRDEGASRDTILAHAERMLGTAEFGERVRTLKTPLWTYVDRLRNSAKPTLSLAGDLIGEVFGQGADKLIAEEGFKSDLVTIADSLVLVSAARAPVPGLPGRLMDARRALAFIERLGACGEGCDPAGLERLLGATLLLPPSLFPLPDNKAERQAANDTAHSQKKSLIEKDNARAQRLLNELGENSAAAEELSDALSRHLHESLHRPRDAAAAPASLSVLPRAKVEKLSAPAKKLALREAGSPEAAVDVPFVVDQLEKANFKLGQTLTTTFGEFFTVDSSPFWLPTCGECKPVILPDPRPENNFTPDTRGEVELAGIQELLIVRQTLLDYRAGEISHIENVLKGERKVATHRKLSRTEDTIVQETETEQQIENELQTTDKYELQSEASRVIKDDRSIEAGVTVTASYGPVNIEAHGNYASSNSTEESRSSAATFARDVVSRSLQRIRERVLNRRTRTEITEVEVTNLHELSNIDGAGHVSGIYRWVDKFYAAQIVNYGKRAMLEFMIPEPGAFYKFALNNEPAREPNVPKPERPGFCRNGTFYPLSPADLQPENYLCFVAKYNVKNVTAPSARYVRVSDVLKYKIDSTQNAPVSFAEVNDSFKIPGGYAPKAISYLISGGNSHRATTGSDESRDDIILAVVAIGDRKVFRYFKNEIGKTQAGKDHWPDIGQVIEWGNILTDIEVALGSYSLGNLADEFTLPSSSAGTGDPDVVKVSLTGHTTLPMSVAVHYSVLCERSQAKFQQWQIDTFNAIMDAYGSLKADYDEAQQNRQDAGDPDRLDRHPLLNVEIVKGELKKFSISLLTGQQYESFNAMAEDYQTGTPQINLTDAAAEGRFVRFFEQALEWRHITYLFYPYFWGRKKHWPEALTTQDNNSSFAQFLRAGYARVWVPVRPGFELVIANYIKCGGEPWGEKDAPILGEADEGSSPTVALIDEIKEQLGADFEFRAGTIGVRKDSDRVAGTGTDFRADDKDREILIALDYYRIAEVDEAAQEIRLREPYRRANQDGIGFAVGVKFVGEPWVVQVPTTLVHLTNSADLISG